MKLKLALLAVSSTYLFSQEISLQWLENKPKTFARDFYILQYLKQDNISVNDAMNAFGLVNRMNNKLLNAYVKKINHDESMAVVQCIKAKAKELVQNSSDCILAGLSLRKAQKLNSLELDTVIEKIAHKDEKFVKELKILNSPIAFSKVTASSKEIFYDIYIKTSRKFRQERLNYKIPKRALKRVKSGKQFEKIIKLVVTDPKMNLAQKSFFELDDSKYSAQTSFFLALNSLTHNRKDESLKYLDNAYKKAYFQAHKDKVMFWKYQITQNKDFLKDLSKSWDINIYTLFAKELLNKQWSNIVFKVQQNNKIASEIFDRTNQFHWINVLRDTKKLDDAKIKKYENIFTTSETLPQLTYLYTKKNRFKKFYYINPYKDLIKDYKIHRQVLINAIARQESQFIPSSISTAYAQGVMQIMPFLSKALAKAKKEPYDIFNMFKPEYSIRYANWHLNSLEKRFEHPLFIAYAYNGGGGFLNSVLKNGLFKEGEYEPFLSMEKIPYSETREYGKKVLTNYVIYSQSMDKKSTTLTALLKTLPKLSKKK